jgi:hypothetical protein
MYVKICDICGKEVIELYAIYVYCKSLEIAETCYTCKEKIRNMQAKINLIVEKQMERYINQLISEAKENKDEKNLQ